MIVFTVRPSCWPKKSKLKELNSSQPQAILLEIGNALAGTRHRQKAVSLLESLAKDENAQVLPFTDHLYRRAFQIFRNHTDKAWGMTDCISFVVMREQGLTEALTTDHHFEQAGFRALLRASL